MKQLWLSDRFRTLWQGRDPFAEVDRLEGEVFRRVASRKTIRVALDGSHYFAKIHHGAGWREIFKNLLHLKLPVLGAENEWRALNLLHEIGVRTITPVAFGRMGRNPARARSFLITEELTGTTSLEDFCARWAAQPPPPQLRRALIEQVAAMVRRMHSHGLNHRDCYICHFHLDTSGDRPVSRDDEARGVAGILPAGVEGVPPSDRGRDALGTRGWGRPRHETSRATASRAASAPLPVLYVIDLHRAQIRRRTPRRWLIKDLAGLYFSALGIGLTRTDRWRFMAAYEQKPLREVLRERGRFWRRVERTALALHRKLRRCRS